MDFLFGPQKGAFALLRPGSCVPISLSPNGRRRLAQGLSGQQTTHHGLSGGGIKGIRSALTSARTPRGILCPYNTVLWDHTISPHQLGGDARLRASDPSDGTLAHTHSLTHTLAHTQGAAFGSCLKGRDVVERAVGDPQFAWQAQHFGDAGVEIVAGAVLRALGHVFVWQGQHLAAV